jgi:hypothetical protein
MCDHCDHQSDSGSSFIFGILFGAVIGAVVAIIIYKNNRSDVIDRLKDKLQSYFNKFTSPQRYSSSKVKRKISKPAKISVVIPKSVESLNLNPAPKHKPSQMFIKKK